MKLFDFFFNIFDNNEDLSDDLDQNRINKYLNNLELKSDVVRLEGPFLSEEVAFHSIKNYKALCRDTLGKINLCITRPIVVLYKDDSFDTRDNCRIQLGIKPFSHRLEIYFKNGDYSIIGIDGKLLLNCEDAKKLKNVLNKFPISKEELKPLK